MSRAPGLAVRAVFCGVFALTQPTLGCGPERIARPPAPAPRAERPTDVIPADLDLVIRVDFARIKRALGPELVLELRQKSVPALPGDEQLIAAALEKSDTVWIALRPRAISEQSDTVVVMRGRFSGIDPRKTGAQPGWEAPVDLGGAWRRFDRKKPKRRSAPSRIYLRADDLLVFVSTAEIDSVERVLERGERDSHLDPAEKGAVSLDARVAPIVEQIAERSPAAARFLSQAVRLRASAELSAGGLDAELELEFSLDERAKAASDAASLLARALAAEEGPTGGVARALRIEAVGSRLVVRLVLDSEALLALVECARKSGPCS